MAPECYKNAVKQGKLRWDLGTWDDFKADVWALGVLIFNILTFKDPFNKANFNEMKQMFEDANFKVPELTKNADLDDASFNAFKEIYNGCMVVDPAKRWTMKQVKTKMDATLKAAKLTNPPASAEYDETDFKPFFDHISKKQGKPSTELFKKHTELLKMLGKIPIPIPKRIDIKTLPIHDEVEDAKGKKFFFQGNLDEKKQPKGLGCKFSDIGFEFGVYGEAPFCVTKLKTEKDTITIIPNSTKPMKTHVNLNGVVIKGYGYVYGKMNFPDGRYYEGGFEKDGDFKGVGRYLDSNGDFYHGEWVNSK